MLWGGPVALLPVQISEQRVNRGSQSRVLKLRRAGKQSRSFAALSWAESTRDSQARSVTSVIPIRAAGGKQGALSIPACSHEGCTSEE